MSKGSGGNRRNIIFPGFVRCVAGLLLACLLLPATVLGQEPNWSGNANLFLGVKFLEEEDWEPVDRQAEAGILLDLTHRILPFHIALDFLYSRGEQNVAVDMLGLGSTKVEVEGETLEMDVGIRKIWEVPGEFRPYLGGGLALIRAEVEAKGLGRSVSDDDTALGIWLEAGAYVTLLERWNLGIDGRWSRAKADLLEVENADVGGWHLGITTGAHF